MDSGAWIALALTRDPLHPRAAQAWGELRGKGARLHTSIPVIIETFTFLDRNADRDVAMTWKEATMRTSRLKVLEVGRAILEQAWSWMDRRELHRLSIVDATSFVLMERRRLRTAFTFDQHFAQAGFATIG